MALTTIFLLVLITAFGVGNVLLFFFRGKEEVSAQGDPAGEEGLTAYSSGEGAAAMLPGKEALLEKKRVAVIPGEAFFKPGFFRISFAVPLGKLKMAVIKINEFVNDK